jgi:allophanate hydrolase
VTAEIWTIEGLRTAYRSGARVTDIIADTLRSLEAAEPGVLIGAPLHALALADAERLALVDPSSLPLYGIPFLVKDNIDIGGVPTTAGCPGFSFIPAEDAAVVRVLREAGAIPVGKANLDQFATGLVGTRSPYGTPTNTIDAQLVPGGSSSGSAVGVALGLVPFSLGTDTAGSGRVPAALNGIVGFKPTLGSTSTLGVVPAMRRFDCPSVFARTVSDASLVAELIAVADTRDPFMRERGAPRPCREFPIVGVPATWPASLGLTDAMHRWYMEAVERLRLLGCEIREIEIEPFLDAGALLYGSSLVAERFAAVGDAIDAGIDGLDPVVAAIITRGRSMSAGDAYRTEYELIRCRAKAARVWHDIDVLALPTTPLLATVDELRDDPFGHNEALGRLTTFVNLLDLMAVVVPIRSGASPVPAGLQLIGPAWHDREVARIAGGFESGQLLPVPQPCTVVVVGAHLRGQPLNHQLTDRHATFLRVTRTSDEYRLYALADTNPPKPGLARVTAGRGERIEVELWSMGVAEFGSFVANVPAPLCIGSIRLADGDVHLGFLCEAMGLERAIDITSFQGWRSYLDRQGADVVVGAP